MGVCPLLNRNVLAGSLLVLALIPGLAEASDRYAKREPVMISNELASPWMLQLRRGPVNGITQSGGKYRAVVAPPPRQARRNPKSQAAVGPDAVQRQKARRSIVIQTAGVAPRTILKKPQQRELPAQFLPQTVAFEGKEKPGTIIIDTQTRHLFYVLDNGKARRYGVGVGKAGFEWSGREKISRKREWPDWRPPAEMRAREAKKGRHLPVHMAGGPANPLGARALYLGSTLYRIHGTNAPWTIGQAVSSGCIRMRNEDVTELYERVKIGAAVIVR